MSVDEVLSVRWDDHGANGLEDLISHQADIMDALQMFRRFEDIFDANDYVTMDAMATTAVIRYCRCFASGVRSTLRIDDLPGLAAQDIALHQYLTDTRHKHIAHAVNQMETQSVFLGIRQADDGSAMVTAAHVGSRTQTAINRDQALEALELCRRWFHHLSGLIAIATDDIALRAQSLTSAELLALPRGPLSPNLEPTKQRPVRR